MAHKDFKFEKPKEGMTFHPTEEEFADPLDYIRRIKPVAETYGICKIKPPENWRAPLKVNSKKFSFRPRIQKLNQLDAITRIKLTFTDRLKQFWSLQGMIVTIPLFASKPLDLYNLYQFAQSDEFTKSDESESVKWKKLSKRMGFTSTCFATELRTFYTKYLLPFHQWKVNYEDNSSPQSSQSSVISAKQEDECSNSISKRVRKRQMGGRRVVLGMNRKYDDFISETPKVRDRNRNCQNCGRRSYNDSVVECEECHRCYHPYCVNGAGEIVKERIRSHRSRKIDTPLPKFWHCPDCLVVKLRPQTELESGFDDAETEYTLEEFGEMADQFKSDYFDMEPDRVPLDLVEKEFWRLVSSMNEDVVVEYGADLDSLEYFTTSEEHTGADGGGPWNFNKLPKLNGSAFGHFNANISGMTSPWIYVGMCFSTFCWHNEDHWSYSISYLHQGDPKTWYGVPGSKAGDFENAMKSAAPELFAETPNLLHQLVTIMNPSVLQSLNVPVCRLDQKPGEFIVTFPKAYHAGFNHGFNFAEAVNFAPADWVPIGRDCVEHYSKFKRACVFSHDELICAMAKEPQKLDWMIASTVNQDLKRLINTEKEFRSTIKAAGVKRLEQMFFENISDDYRQCDVCKTTLFISAITCVCYASKEGLANQKMVCPKHFSKFDCVKCKKNPSGYILRYRHTFNDLLRLYRPLKERAGRYDTWKDQTLQIIDTYKGQPTLHQLEIILKQAEGYGFPRTTLLEAAEETYYTTLEEVKLKSQAQTTPVTTITVPAPKRPRTNSYSSSSSSLCIVVTAESEGSRTPSSSTNSNISKLQVDSNSPSSPVPGRRSFTNITL